MKWVLLHQLILKLVILITRNNEYYLNNAYIIVHARKIIENKAAKCFLLGTLDF